MKIFTLLIVALSSLVAAPASLAQLPTPHSTLANTCSGCHGTFGYSSVAMPRIAGLDVDYLKRVMREFRTGKRSSTVMGRLARGYSDEEIDSMAAFFASQLWVSPEQQVQPPLVERGRKIHEQRCSMCHQNDGRHQDATVPRIAGQWREYLQTVLEEYHQPERRMPHKFMGILARQLLPGEINALSHFYASKR